MRSPRRCCYGPIAQSQERRTRIAEVVGSNPIRSTKFQEIATQRVGVQASLLVGILEAPIGGARVPEDRTRHAARIT